MTDGGNTWQPPQPGAAPPPPPPGGGFGPPTGAPSAADRPTEPVDVTLDETTGVQTPAGPSGTGRSRGKVIAAVVGAVAVVGAGVFAITRISGDASAGGAASPEAAANALLDALDNEDALGAIDVLLPGERETFRQPLQDLVSELQRLEVLSDDNLTGISGVDLTVEDRDVEIEETNVDDIVNLTVHASVSTSVDGESLPIGDWIRDNVDEDEIAAIDEETPAEDGSFPITAVRKDGRWYLSLFFTAAEQARLQTEFDIPTEGIALNGGDSPEAAMDNFLAAAGELDLAGMLGTLNPNEFEALHRYAPLFLDDAQAELDGVDASVEISDTAYTVGGTGSKRSIGITAATVEATIDGEHMSARLEDGCWIAEADGEKVNSCELADQWSEELNLEDVVDDPQAVEDAVADIQEAFADYENPGFILQEVDGAWYLSPMATFSDQVLAVIRALTRQEIEHLTEQIGELVGTLEDEMNEGDFDVPTFDDFELPGDEPLGDEPRVPTTVAPDETTPSDDTNDTNDTDGTAATDDTLATDETTEVEEFGSECYAELDAANAASCFDALVAAGEIDPVVVPWYLRHPECGSAESMWNGEYFSLEDAEFVAAVEALQPCVQGLLASGQLDEFDLTGELVHPECLEGRNPYLLEEGDPAYEAFTACAYG